MSDTKRRNWTREETILRERLNSIANSYFVMIQSNESVADF